MFTVIISIVFAIVSVSDIFSAEKKCDVYFYKLKDAVNNVFSVDRSEQVMGFKLTLGSNDLKANSGHVIEFLKSKIKEKSYNELIKIYCLEGSRNGYFSNGLRKEKSLNIELTDDIISVLAAEFIKEEVDINGSIKVYFYSTQKLKKPGDKGDSKKGKCCCC